MAGNIRKTQEDQSRVQQELSAALELLVSQCTSIPQTATNASIRGRIEAIIRSLTETITALGSTESSEQAAKFLQQAKDVKKEADDAVKASTIKQQELDTLIQSFTLNAANASEDRKKVDHLQHKISQAQSDQQVAVEEATRPLQEEIGKLKQQLEDAKSQREEDRKQCSLEKQEQYDRGHQAAKDAMEVDLTQKQSDIEQERQKVQQEREKYERLQLELRQNNEAVIDERVKVLEQNFKVSFGQAQSELSSISKLAPSLTVAAE